MDELLSQIRAEGRIDSEGRFTLDLARALEKMRDFQLEYPQRYVLNLVAGAAASGAMVIDTKAHGASFQVEWDGPPITQEQMLQLLDPFHPQANETVREISRGLAACRALEPSLIEVESQAAYLKLDRAALLIEPRATRARNRVNVSIKKNILQHLKLSDHVDVAPLLQRCNLALPRVTVNGRAINVDLEPARTHASVYLEGPPGTRLRIQKDADGTADFSALICLGPLPRMLPSFTILHHQVAFEDSEFESVYPGAVVILRANGLEKDLSQSSIVRTPGLQEIIGRIRHELDKMALDLVAYERPGWREVEQPLNHRLRQRNGVPSDPVLLPEEPYQWNALVKEFWDVPFLRRSDESPAGPSAFVPDYIRTGFQPVTDHKTEKPATMPDGSPILMRPASGPRADLVDIIFPEQDRVHFVDGIPFLTGERFLSPRLPEGDYLVRRFLTGLSGELGFPHEIYGPPLVMTKLKGSPPVTVKGPFPMLPQGLVVVVRPSDGWDRTSLERAIAACLPSAYIALEWGRHNFPEKERPLAEAHLREAARLAIKLWRRAGKPTPTPRDYLWLRMHEGGPQVRFIEANLLERLPEDKTMKTYRGSC